MKNVFDMLRLDGRTAIVTGVSRAGLGWDFAGALAEAGANIVITSRYADKAEAEAAAFQEQYPDIKVMAAVLEATEYASCEAMAKKVKDAFGSIDILVNNAGGGGTPFEGNFWERDAQDFTAIINANLIGLLNVTRAVTPYMVEQGGGKVINIGSIAGMVGRDRQLYHESGLKEQSIGYAAAKGGVISATRDLACSLAPKNICVNSISPGGFFRNQIEAFVEGYSAITPLRRMGTIGEDLKGAVLLLASDAGNYITGHNLLVDGGFSVSK